MSTGENIQFLRKQKGYTQEEFAEQMNVSRQTISKWESDSCFPEMEKLLAMCDLFHCKLDDLVRGDVQANTISDTAGYDAHMNRFAKKISIGVGLVLLGVSAMFGVVGLGVNDEFAACALFPFLIIAVAFFVTGGLEHEAFTKKHPYVTPFYTEEEVDAYNRKFPVMLVTAISIVLLGVVFLLTASAVIGEEVLDESDLISGRVMMGFMLFIMAAASIFVYSGMLKSKYDVSAYNKEQSKEQKNEKSRAEVITSAASGCIMMIATIIFLIWGFVLDGWKIGWIVYPIGGILCGIVSVISNAVCNTDSHSKY